MSTADKTDNKNSLFYKTDMTPQKFCEWLNEYMKPMRDRSIYYVYSQTGKQKRVNYKNSVYIFGTRGASQGKIRVEIEKDGLRLTAVSRKLVIVVLVLAALLFVMTVAIVLITIFSGDYDFYDVIGIIIYDVFYSAFVLPIALLDKRIALRALKKRIVNRERMEYKNCFDGKSE